MSIDSLRRAYNEAPTLEEKKRALDALKAHRAQQWLAAERDRQTDEDERRMLEVLKRPAVRAALREALGLAD
jgi:hypothetical protein